MKGEDGPRNTLKEKPVSVRQGSVADWFEILGVKSVDDQPGGLDHLAVFPHPRGGHVIHVWRAVQKNFHVPLRSNLSWNGDVFGSVAEGSICIKL